MNSDGDRSNVISQKKLKLLMGGMAVGLPTVLYLGNRFLFGINDILGSISSYYYSDMRDVFVGILFSIGVFMVTYEGYGIFDRLLSSIGGVLSIMVALFPTTASGLERDLNGTIHLVAAGCFYLILTIFVLLRFTKSDPLMPKTGRKKIRNLIYYLCGLVLLASIALIVITEMGYFELPLDNSTFWLEYLANTAFGTAFFVKGEGMFFLNDDPILDMKSWEVFGFLLMVILVLGSLTMLGYIFI